MIWSQLAVGYLEMSLLLVPAALASYLIARLVRGNSGTMSAAVGLKLNYMLMGCVLVMPFLSGLLPDSGLSNGPAQIWFAPSMHGAMETASEPGVLAISLSKAGATKQVRDHTVNNASMYLALLAVMALGLVLGADWRRVKRLTDRSYLVRRKGAVRVLVSEEMTTPFSFWVPGRAYAVLPAHLTQNPGAFNLALRHELQHHRQGDTRMVYLSEALKFLFFWNPCAHLWRKLMDETREYACDEALVGQKTVSPQAYGRCLLEVAAATLKARDLPIGATGMVSSQSGIYLKRRIEMIFGNRKGKRGTALAAGLTVLLLMTTTIWAASGLVRDRRINMNHARDLANHASADSGIPIVVNDAVLEQLNRFLGTPDGQEFVRQSLDRMQKYRSTLEQKFDEYRIPYELLALPILESGYQNLSPNEKAPHAAGLWQFIPSTARKFNLTVDDETDERLNPELATDAALRYLSALNLRYQDWSLAVLAYNAGEKVIQAGINETGERDAWVLIDNGFSGDANYLSKLTALVIIIKNPQVLN